MLDTVYFARHGFRMSTAHFSSVGMQLARDPPLTAHGEEQVRDLAAKLASLPENERPQLVISSPYTRCIQTARPSAQAIHCALCIEPGLAEWYPPVPEQERGKHPSPPSAEHVRKHFTGVSDRWSPVLYPDPRGESIDDLKARALECLRRIDARCAEWKVSRVLLVGHAAPGIALGKMLQADGDIRRARSFDIRAGTASLSKYVLKEGKWEQVYNGDTSYLPNGSEREWDFSYVPENITESGLRPDWKDPYAPKDAALVFQRRSHL